MSDIKTSHLHEFKVTGSWEGGRAGRGEFRSEHVSMVVSLPKEIGGSAKGTNPEEMLAATAASCYLITLGIILEKRSIAHSRLEVASTCVMDAEKLKITRITHEPRVELAAQPTAEVAASLTEAIHLAEKICLISNALRGNVEVTVRWSGQTHPDEARGFARIPGNPANVA